MFITSFYLNKNFNNTLQKEIYGLKKSWQKDLNNVKAFSSDFCPNYDFFDVIKGRLADHLKNVTQREFKPSCWWANFYEPGHYTTIHRHEPEYISSIVIVKGDKSNPLYFDINPGVLRVNDSDGLVLLFDSTINHAVDICKEERITLAVDFRLSV